jgi:hypothetical protein
MASQLPVTDEEILNIMVDGGEKLCDYAITQWASYKYATYPNPTQNDEDTRRESLLRWNQLKSQIRPLAKKLGGYLHANQT